MASVARMGRRQKAEPAGEQAGGAGGEGGDDPPARQMGWGSAVPPADPFAEPATQGPARAGRRAGGAEAASTRDEGGPNRRKHFEDDEASNQIMEIPDLETDVGFDEEEEFNKKVAAPPKARQQRVQSIRELDQTVQYTLPQSKDEIDLSLLISALCPVEKVREEDGVWEPEMLLSEVAFEIQTEKEAMEEKEEEMAEGGKKAEAAGKVQEQEQSLFSV